MATFKATPPEAPLTLEQQNEKLRILNKALNTQIDDLNKIINILTAAGKVNQDQVDAARSLLNA